MSSTSVVSASTAAPQLQEAKKLTDSQAWGLDDQVICNAALDSWRSSVYSHYDLSLERQHNDTGELYMRYKFTCKHDPINHATQYRQRQDTSQGTNNLLRKALACNLRQKGDQDLITKSGAAQEFSAIRLRALLALWSAHNHRSFELVQDELFAMIVNELRPGTLLPDLTTLSRDVRGIYQQYVDHIRHYFQNINHIHLAIDGWTAPTSHSYLGIIAIWQSAGKLSQTILEFVLLSHRHNGAYLAQQTAACLNKYGLGDKAYLSVFSKPTRRKRSLKTKASTDTQRQSKRQRIDDRALSAPSSTLGNIEVPEKPDAEEGDAMAQLESDQGECSTGDESDDEVEDAVEAFTADKIDEDKAEHDSAAVTACVNRAFTDIEQRFGVKVPQSDRSHAQQLIPKVAGLAKRAHKTAYIQHKFEEYVATILNLNHSQSHALARRMVTRWNTDLDSLQSHMKFRPAVKLLTADRDLSLKRYQLTDAQWDLAGQLISELKSFESLTKLFSKTEVPSIHQVVPALLKLQDQLLSSVTNPPDTLNPLLRVAARAALEVFDKYMRLFEDSSVYWVALVMCPNYKLEWFRSRKYSDARVSRIEKLVYSTFDSISAATESQSSQVSECTESNIEECLVDDWLLDDEACSHSIRPGSDTIREYLEAPLVPVQSIRQGGLLQYWAGQRKPTPRVATFALSILSAPASSVDAERAFSGGQLTINHLQHTMNELTFEAKMAVGSWFETPLLPSVDSAAAILADRIRV